MAIVAAESDMCDAPPEDLTVEQAHAVMQEHLRCITERCVARRAARDLLVRAHRMSLAGGTSRR